MRLANPIPNNFSYNTVIVLAIIGSLSYGFLTYFTVRSDFFQLILLTAISFLVTYVVIEKSKLSFNHLLYLALIYRLIFIWAIPNLSQDFFRFFWDGQLILQGINPFIENVNYYFNEGLDQNITQADILLQGMGELNASHYSNYPPTSQFIYAVSAWLAKNSIMGFIISLRLILISFDILFVFFAKKLLIHFNKNPKNLFWYILNPLCLIEVTGNLHLEGVMISLFIIGFYFLIKNQKILSALFLSLSISTKLLSLIFLPITLKYFLKTYKFKRASKGIFYFGFWLLLFLAIQFAFFYDEKFISNFTESVGLWFGKFEFNASIFYVVRWFGYQHTGWNIIQTYGKIMPIISIILFLILLLKFKTSPVKMLECFMWMLTVYFLLSTTVHPWYILFPLALSVFNTYKYVYVWSFVVIFSYFSYKISGDVFESTWLLAIEYGILLMAIMLDIGKRKTYFKATFLSK
ncbi:mannosyltransferase [Flavobacteriaceae bacterium 14752]|uniref:mannosyltransferase n=1 Tax=Mesohalobacter salilacus TaxID=2491711 RepID=UPI000F62ED8F|nr:mannosyltransferase [Flavobacteriaceae bacterium 14752]